MAVLLFFVPTHVGWGEIALRLALTLVAGGVIGLNRGEHRRAAGLRTTLLLALAASLAMILVNVLLPLQGKATDSFVTMDLMRLPLGILSGMGFIGAGAILRKGDLILGVTTAATLWFVTVVGLCLGGGQIILGSIATALGSAVLWLLKPVENCLKQHRQGDLSVVVESGGPSQEDIQKSAEAAGYRISSFSIVYQSAPPTCEIQCLVKWESRSVEIRPPGFISDLAKRDKILKISWKPILP